MTDQTDESEARRLIDEAFGDQVANAQAAMTAFVNAADAYECEDLRASAKFLDGYVQSAPSECEAAYALCAAGAIKIAELFAGVGTCDCGDSACSGVAIDADGQVDVITRLALAAVNAASESDLDELTSVLTTVHGIGDDSALCALASCLVAMRGDVRTLVEQSSA